MIAAKSTLIASSLIFLNSLLWGQSGPYPLFELPQSETWPAFDSVLRAQNMPAAFVWQPGMPSPVQGIVISKQGLALLPAAILDSALLRKETWLGEDPPGEELPLRSAARLAVLKGMEDLSSDLLDGIPDTISPAARSIKIANRLPAYDQKPSDPSKDIFIRPFYLGARYYRYEWQYVEARLIGQIFAPNGHSFALVRLLPLTERENINFSFFRVPTGKKPAAPPLFVGGMQSYPGALLAPSGIEIYYTLLAPLLQESQLILAANWENKQKHPDWLDKLEAANELEMPLHPFADPTEYVREARQAEDSLLQILGDEREEQWKYRQIQRRIQSGYEESAPLLEANLLGREIIPTRLQLFRLVRLLRQWEKNMNAGTAMPQRSSATLARFLAFFYNSFDPETDQAVAGQLFDLYLKRIRGDLQSPFAVEQWAQAEKDPQIMAAALYQKSRLTDGEQVRKALLEDPAVFFRQLQHDYAYGFVQKWEDEHLDLIYKPLSKLEENLREEQRKMIGGLLQYVPQKTSVEKGGLSFTMIQPETEWDLGKISPHFLGNYPEGSPVFSADGRLLGVTCYEGDNRLLSGPAGNKALAIDFLEELQVKFPDHPVTREIFGN